MMGNPMDRIFSFIRQFLFIFAVLFSISSVIAADINDTANITSNRPNIPASKIAPSDTSLAPLDIKNTSIKGALCYIQADNKVIFVDEVLTKHFSLPGGTIENEEPPKVAAKRETWEETGIIVTVLEELARTDTAVIYHCQPDSGIVAFSKPNKDGYYVLPTWFAPSYSFEVSSVFLAEPDLIKATQYRYPAQYESQVFGHQVLDAPILYIDNAFSAAPRLHQFELPLVKQIHDGMTSSPLWSEAMLQILKAINATSSIYLLLGLFPILYFFLGHKFSLRLGVMISFTIVIMTLIQLGLKYPRPYAYDPSLTLDMICGFGTPSLIAAITVVWIIYAYHQYSKFHSSLATIKSAVLLLLLLMIQVLSGAALGVSFPSDVIFGYILGIFIVINAIQIETRQYTWLLKLDYTILLWGMIFILVLLSWFSRSLYIGALTASILGFACSLIMFKQEKVELWGGLLLRLPLTWLSIIAIVYYHQYLFNVYHFGSLLSYTIHCGTCFVVTFLVITLGRIKPIYTRKKHDF